VGISKALIFPIWVFSLILLFILIKWAGPSIDASRKSRDETKARNKQSMPVQISTMPRSSPSPAWPQLAASLAVISLPISVPIFFLWGGYHTAIITDSIPDHRILAPSVVFLILVFWVFLNRKLFFKQRPLNGAFPMLFVLSSFIMVIHGNDFYRATYERYLFSAPNVYHNQVVETDRMRREYGRGGASYYAYVNPNNVSTINPEIRVSRDLYSLWTDANAGHTNTGSAASARCLLHVEVNKSRDAERIVWKSPIDASSVASCF
jgi:hypothetical protein